MINTDIEKSLEIDNYVSQFGPYGPNFNADGQFKSPSIFLFFDNLPPPLKILLARINKDD